MPVHSQFISLEGSCRRPHEHRGETAEILRFFALPPAWKGRELRRLAERAANDLDADVCVQGTAEHRLLRLLIPEIARRLGEPCLPPPCAELASYDGFDLRHATMTTMAMAPKDHASSDWSLLVRSIREGNPIAIALDLSCPPAMEGDWAAAQLRSAWVQFGIDRMTWHPELLTMSAA